MEVRTTEIDPNLTLTIDAQDLDELLGNLMNNVWRHTRSSAAITAAPTGSNVELAIEDDGPRLTENEIGEALVPGRRLDGRGDGRGFGLPIAQTLAEMNGGSLVLGRSVLWGGLRAAVTFPASVSTG